MITEPHRNSFLHLAISYNSLYLNIVYSVLRHLNPSVFRRSLYLSPTNIYLSTCIHLLEQRGTTFWLESRALCRIKFSTQYFKQWNVKFTLWRVEIGKWKYFVLFAFISFLGKCIYFNGTSDWAAILSDWAAFLKAVPVLVCLQVEGH